MFELILIYMLRNKNLKKTGKTDGKEEEESSSRHFLDDRLLESDF